MAALDNKPQAQTKRRPAAPTDEVSTPAVELARATRKAIVDRMVEKRPYLKFAFANPYNLSLLGGALAAAGITLNPVIALVALGAEALWLLHAPDSERLKHILWDPRFEKVRAAMEKEERDKKTQNLEPEQRERIEGLVERQAEINRLAEENPSFSGELLKGELVKTGHLVNAFVDMAITCGRYEEYLYSVDMQSIERDQQRWEGKIRKGTPGDPETEIASKNLAIIVKRLEKIREIRNYLSVARGQLDLIENSFQLIADQIVTMQSPQELQGQLDELLDGVEAIRESAADTERLLGSIGVR